MGLTSETHVENYSLASLLLKEEQFHTGSDKTGFRRETNRIQIEGDMTKHVFCARAKTGVAGRPR